MTVPDDLAASELLDWPGTIANLEAKQAVAERALSRLRDGQVVGIGSGSNAYLTLWAIGRRVADGGPSVAVVCSSYETEAAARRLGLRLLPLGGLRPDWGVDGADEVDPDHRLLKGRGGALYREKLLWRAARLMCLAVDSSKFVDRLGARFPVPVEVGPRAEELVARELAELGATEVAMRVAGGKDGPVITESGNLLLDARFEDIPFGLGAAIKAVPGVIETGLFEDYEFETL